MFQRIANITRYRELILRFLLRNVKESYQGTILGYFWALLMPLPTMIVFVFVFTYVLPVKIPRYPLYLLTGILVWNHFFASLTECTWSIRRGGDLLRKVRMPPEVFPISSVLTNLVLFCLSLVILVPFLFAYKVSLTGHIWCLPVIILWQTLFCYGLGMIFGLLHIYFRDTGPLVETVLGMWFYATPVFYTTDLMSEKVRMLYYLNPTAVMVDLYRWSILGNSPPPFFHLLIWAGLTVTLLIVGVSLYERHGIQLARYL